ncbi:MAG TPA: enoyl-CoA hydratase/isomerase family protein [Anaerolineales bacterium]|nr:enoyl-CoA hydratase/isomerase family protein [Anaerolineales bacterium]
MEDQNNLVKRDFVNGVGILSLNRPDALNALNAQLFNTLLSEISMMEADPHIACIILTGGGRTFCVGADIKYMAETQAETEQVIQFLGKFDQVANTSKPLIACVNGAALGGGFELALACDFILASERAFFSFPEVGLGLLPGGGGTQRITRLVGKQRAMEMILTNQRISAAEAIEFGFVNKVCPPENLLEEGLRLGSQIAKLSPEAVRSARKAILFSENNQLETGLVFEKNLFAQLLNSDNGREGVSAFIEKRPPKWKKAV